MTRVPAVVHGDLHAIRIPINTLRQMDYWCAMRLQQQARASAKAAGYHWQERWDERTDEWILEVLR